MVLKCTYAYIKWRIGALEGADNFRGGNESFLIARGSTSDLSLTSGVGLTRSCGGFESKIIHYL